MLCGGGPRRCGAALSGSPTIAAGRDNCEEGAGRAAGWVIRGGRTLIWWCSGGGPRGGTKCWPYRGFS